VHVIDPQRKRECHAADTGIQFDHSPRMIVAPCPF
jgi:hypothetical protein